LPSRAPISNRWQPGAGLVSHPTELPRIASRSASCIARTAKTISTAAGGFLAGDESDDYASHAANFELYDVNTIANYDPDIIPHLDAPVGSAYAVTRHPAS
jgi:hypothetical protein